MMDEHKFCFIICSNKEYFLEECLFYINKLEIPTGYSIDVISIEGAQSMANGYNEGMLASDAKYKIYLHQDVFLIYKSFLQAVLDIFLSDPTIGMIGMVGAPKMPVGGVVWYGAREGMIYASNVVQGEYSTYQYTLEDGLHEVDAIDGFMMITSVDIPWREDKFDGWDFYDVSQSFEFRKKGYRVVVPEQLCPWCMHDDGILGLTHYDKYRRICMEEYPEYFYPERFCVSKVENITNRMQTSKLRVVIPANNQFEMVKCLIETVKSFADVEDGQIIVVDNYSEDGLRHWLRRQQNYNYIICEEAYESYTDILREVIKQFIGEEDILIVSPNLLVLPEAVDALHKALRENTQIGAVCAKTDLNSKEKKMDFLEAAQCALAQAGRLEMREIKQLPCEAVMIRNELLKQLESLAGIGSAEDAWESFWCQGSKMGYQYYEVKNALFYNVL